MPLGQPSVFSQRLGDYPLQLAIHRPELIGGPLLDSAHGGAIDAKHETLGLVLFLGHLQK